MNEEMSSVQGFVEVLRESLPETVRNLEIRYGIPFDSGCDVTLLGALEQARKAHDTALSNLGHEAEVWDRTRVSNERVILNSLRKWKGPIKGNLHVLDDVLPNKIGDATNDLREYRERTAIDGFVARNDLAANRRENADELLVYMSRIIKRMLHGFLDEYEVSNPRFGDGAVYERISVLHRWDEVGRNPFFESVYGDINWHAPAGHTRARLSAVPKQWNKDRLITVEPHLSTFLQHKARFALSKTLINNGFAFLADQSISRYDGPRVHRLRALEASVYNSPESSWATLDLSDASDSITYFQVTEVFPPEVMACLDRCRSDTYEVNLVGSKAPRVENMYIFAGMGNATTFMVETIMFYALMRAAVKRRRLAWEGGSVYGDDLLIKGLAQVDAVKEDLAILGYRVNVAKSFSGLGTPVRESCGCWAFQGLDVYVPPFEGYGEDPAGMLGLADWIRRAPAPLEYSVLKRHEHWVNTPEKVANTVSVCDLSRAVSHSRIRWNRCLQRLEVKALAPKTADERVEHSYEANQGGCLAVLSGQVGTKPLPLDSQQRARQVQAFRLDRINCWVRRMGFQNVNQLNETEWLTLLGIIDEETRYWNPHGFNQYVITATKPYSVLLHHQWVSVSAGEGSHWLPTTSVGTRPMNWDSVIVAFNKRETEFRLTSGTEGTPDEIEPLQPPIDH